MGKTTINFPKSALLENFWQHSSLRLQYDQQKHKIIVKRKVFNKLAAYILKYELFVARSR